MSEFSTIAAVQPALQVAGAVPALRVAGDGTALYGTLRQAEAARALTLTGKSPLSAKGLSQTTLGGTYLTKSGQELPLTLGSLAEFQLGGMTVVVVAMAGLFLSWSIISRLLRPVESTGEDRDSSVAGGIHPGLSDQQLVVLLTAAACEIMGGRVRVERFHQVSVADSNWAAQGRSVLQSHQLK